MLWLVAPLDVWYEDLCSDNELQIPTCLSSSGWMPNRSVHRRISGRRRALPDIIGNYAEVAEELAATPFEWMLEK